MIWVMQRTQRGRDYGGRGLNGGRARHWRMSGLKIAKGVRGDNWSEGWLRNRWPDFKAWKTSWAVPGFPPCPIRRNGVWGTRQT